MSRHRILWSLWFTSLVVLALSGCGLPSPTAGSAPAPSDVAQAPPATAPVSPALTPPTTIAPPSATPALPSATPAPPSATPAPPSVASDSQSAIPTATPAAPPATPVPPSVTPDLPSATSTATPSTTPPPTPIPSPTLAATATTGPKIAYFHVAPVTTQNVGDRLSMEWQAAGTRAQICPINGMGPVESWCREVPLKGTDEFVTTEELMGIVGLGLRAWDGTASVWSVVYVHLQCQNLRRWFFDRAPQSCPATPPRESYAAGQYFEGGLMIWIADWDDFYIFYRGKDEQGFQTFDWILEPTLRPGASEDHRVGETPPPGLYEPVSGFGLIWRGEMEGVRADVRQRLGWATAPEAGFDTAYQCITPSHPRSWTCFLRGPQGEILQLSPDSTAQVRFLWEEW